MVNLAQSTSSLNITRNIQNDDSNPDWMFDSGCSPENHSENNATVKSEPENPPEAIVDENLPSTSGLSTRKTPKKTRKTNASTKRNRETDTEHDLFINSQSQRLRLITD